MGAFQILTKLIQGLQVTQPTLETGITAHAGGTQALGYQLTRSISIISTCATTGDSVVVPNLLPPNVPIKIVNNGAQTLDIYPPLGGNLGAGTNAALTLTAGHTMELITSGTGGNTVSKYTRIITYATT